MIIVVGYEPSMQVYEAAIPTEQCIKVVCDSYSNTQNIYDLKFDYTYLIDSLKQVDIISLSQEKKYLPHFTTKSQHYKFNPVKKRQQVFRIRSPTYLYYIIY